MEKLRGKYSKFFKTKFKYYLGKSLVENYTEAITYDIWNFILTGDKSAFKDLYFKVPAKSFLESSNKYYKRFGTLPF